MNNGFWEDVGLANTIFVKPAVVWTLDDPHPDRATVTNANRTASNAAMLLLIFISILLLIFISILPLPST
jgi:hypothetical protein